MPSRRTAIWKHGSSRASGDRATPQRKCASSPGSRQCRECLTPLSAACGAEWAAQALATSVVGGQAALVHAGAAEVPTLHHRRHPHSGAGQPVRQLGSLTGPDNCSIAARGLALRPGSWLLFLAGSLRHRWRVRVGRAHRNDRVFFQASIKLRYYLRYGVGHPAVRPRDVTLFPHVG